MASNSGAQYVPTAGAGAAKQWWGVYDAYIAVNADPLDQGRVKLRVPQVFGAVTSGWASPMVPVTYIPKVGTAVTVMFVGGDPTRATWSGNFAVAGAAPVVINAGPPSDSAPGQFGEIWYDSSNGMKTYEWNGAAWVAYQIGTGGVAANIGLTEPTITGGVITGSQFIADGTSGEFLGYTGTPATGNMNMSLSPVAGSDGHSNPYLDGLTVYLNPARIQVHINPVVGAPAVEMPTGLTSEEHVAAVYTWSPNRGAAGEYIETVLAGPASTHDSTAAYVYLVSSAKDGSGAPVNGELGIGNSAIAEWNATGFQVFGNISANNFLPPDTWHSMTLQNGWSVGSGGIARYKRMPDNTVMVHCTNLVPGNLSPATAFWFIPSGYVPASPATQNFPAYWTVGSGSTPTGLKEAPMVYTSSNGLYIGTFPSNTVGMSFAIQYTLD